MKHLRRFNESVWSPEEFIDEVISGLGEYNLSSVEVREIINRIDIDDAIQSGQHPNVIINQLIDDLDLKSRGNSGFMSVRTPRNWNSQIKYF